MAITFTNSDTNKKVAVILNTTYKRDVIDFVVDKPHPKDVLESFKTLIASRMELDKRLSTFHELYEDSSVDYLSEKFGENARYIDWLHYLAYEELTAQDIQHFTDFTLKYKAQRYVKYIVAKLNSDPESILTEIALYDNLFNTLGDFERAYVDKWQATFLNIINQLCVEANKSPYESFRAIPMLTGYQYNRVDDIIGLWHREEAEEYFELIKDNLK